jgi:hypothetical protein
MKKVVKAFHLISKPDADDAGVPVFADLLRYDGAIVEDLGGSDVMRTHFYLVSTAGRGTELHYERWAAHGVPVAARNLHDTFDVHERALAILKQRGVCERCGESKRALAMLKGESCGCFDNGGQ